MSNDQSALADWERDLLAAIGTGPIVVLGVGNRDKGDDGVGSVVAGELSHQLSVISPATASTMAAIVVKRAVESNSCMQSVFPAAAAGQTAAS